MSKVPTTLEELSGIRINPDAFIVIFKTEWNDAICQKLTDGCIEVLNEAGVKYKVITVPGAVEIPFAVNQYWKTYSNITATRPSAFICFGCVVQGGTPHFEYVCNMVSQGITSLNLTLPIPTIFGVLTVNNMQQAEERVGGTEGHKGREAAAAAIKMIGLFNEE